MVESGNEPLTAAERVQGWRERRQVRGEVRISELWVDQLTADRLQAHSQACGAPLTFVIPHLLAYVLNADRFKRLLMREGYGNRLREAWEQQERKGEER